MAYVAKDPVARFWSKVDRNGPPHPYDATLGPCWDWTRSTRNGGYGQVYISPEHGGPQGAHRYAFYLTHGRWPQVARHTCDRPICVNPDHLLDGTLADNNADTRARSNPFGGKIAKRGQKHPLARVTPEEALSIRAERRNGMTVRDIMAAHGLGATHVRRIINGDHWSLRLTQPEGTQQHG